jgi:hypothetical protein
MTEKLVEISASAGAGQELVPTGGGREESVPPVVAPQGEVDQ